jgi:signal transduction histidine kinase
VDLWPRDVARVFQQSDADALAAGHPVESAESATLDDGTQRHWMIFKFPMPSADGRRLVAGLVLDVTERKRAEEELNRSREQLRSLAAHLQSIREQERTRISREIHDELGQMLTGLKMDLSWIEKRIAALPDADTRTPIAGKVKSMFSLLDVMVKSVRKISAELRPGALDDLGLLPAMEWQSREWQSRTGIECHLHSTLGDLVVPPEVGTAVFRIFQESLTNVARHAQATRVDVQLQGDAETIWMELKDNGRGITDEELRHSKSLGLVGMRERATMLGGDFRIEGGSGQGTSLKIRIPMSA